MCFSATASLIAGVATTGIGVASVKSVREKREIPLASIPLLFGLQQFVEGGIWLSAGMPVLNTALTYFFMFYSHIWWPFFMPIAIFLVEKDKIRKKLLFFLMIIGACVALYYIVFTLMGPVTSNIINHSIAYTCTYYNQELVFAFYMIATAICCLISSHKMIQFFGLAVLISSIVTYQMYITTFTSVFCFFSAILSLILYLHFKKEYKIGEFLNEMVEKMKETFEGVK